MSASTNTTIPQIRLPFLLDQPVKSRIIARIFSQTPKTVDIAANTINRKKSEPHILPPGILLNTVAIVSNKRFGPELTSRL